MFMLPRADDEVSCRCRVGKMLVHGALLRCAAPVLTIARRPGPRPPSLLFAP